MKLYHKISAIAFLLFVFLLTGLFILLPDSSYSAKEKRNLSQLPEFTLSTVTSGKFMDGIEDYAADQFPLRDDWMSMKTAVSRLFGAKESQGVYLMKDGSLAERFDGSDPKNYQETVDSLLDFSARYPEVNQYFMLVPNAVSVYAENLPKHALTEDQESYIRSFYDAIGGNLHCIELFDAFRAIRNNMQLYYRTDHHWTTGGAYEAFRTAAEAMGLSDSTEYTSGTVCNDFYGSLTSESGFSVKYPDAIDVCLPVQQADNLYTVTYVSESERTASCYETAYLSSDDPYQVFFGGNHPLIRIETGAASDRSLLVIKDSYANAFIPFLIPEYASITVLDPRYYYDDIDALMGNNFTDVLFLYNVNTFSEDTNLKMVLRNNQ